MQCIFSSNAPKQAAVVEILLQSIKLILWVISVSRIQIQRQSFSFPVLTCHSQLLLKLLNMQKRHSLYNSDSVNRYHNESQSLATFTSN